MEAMMMQTTLKVTGMTCMHCVGAVKTALEQVPGVETAEVSLEQAQALVSGSADVAAMKAAIKEAGYSAEVE
jgi:copper chaperone CopZ